MKKVRLHFTLSATVTIDVTDEQAAELDAWLDEDNLPLDLLYGEELPKVLERFDDASEVMGHIDSFDLEDVDIYTPKPKKSNPAPKEIE